MSDISVTTPARRVYHCTFYKCGSQWVRDLLTDPRIAEHSGCKLSASGVEVSSTGWPEVPQDSIASPLYTVGDGHWMDRPNPDPADRALVVLRDPRDMVVSLVFSVNYSHVPDGINRLMRRPIRNASRIDRIQLGMHMLAHWFMYIQSWAKTPATGALVTKYETLVSDEIAEFRRIIAFLGWPVPAEVVDEVARAHSFQARTGRKRGEENEFSHRRKGVAGDWRRHFTQGLGRLFEETFPAMLVELGYETDENWWRALPEVIVESVQDVTDERTKLLKALEQQETELAVVREAATQRLEKINILTKLAESASTGKAVFEKAANDRLRIIETMKQELDALRAAAKGRLAEPTVPSKHASI